MSWYDDKAADTAIRVAGYRNGFAAPIVAFLGSSVINTNFYIVRIFIRTEVKIRIFVRIKKGLVVYLGIIITAMAIQAVLTADIVHSTKLIPPEEQKLMRRLRKVLSPYKFEFYRGDSFQVYLKDAERALETALLCRTAAIGIARGTGNFTPNVRISIGIGKAKEPLGSLGTARGEAFVLSGRAFDKIAGSNTKLIISTANELAGEGLQVLGSYVNAIFDGMTAKQANVIFELLKGNSQQAAAEKLKKSKSTISQHVTAARWDEINTLLQQYKNIINHIT